MPVAVGVLVRADGAALLAERPPGKPYAGYWEFPGGKIEEGESVAQALERELLEELGIRAGPSIPWAVIEHDYPHAYVRLHFRRIFQWQGTPHPVEGQRLMFLLPASAAPKPLLPAALPALRWLQLPTISGFSARTAIDAAQAVHWMDHALERGLRQIIWHEPALRGPELATALRLCSARARAYGARFLVDSRDLRRKAGSTDSGTGASARGSPPPAPVLDHADGCYLSAASLRKANERPPARWVAAGICGRQDLVQATALGCDFAILEPGPRDGGGGPGAGAADLAVDAPMPLYLARQPGVGILDEARRLGFHGLAAQLSG